MSLRIFSVSVSVAVNHFTTSDRINQLWNNKFKLLLVFVSILSYVIPQNTAHFSSAILYYNTILNIIQNLNFSGEYVWNFQFIKIHIEVVINVHMPESYTSHILIGIIFYRKISKNSYTLRKTLLNADGQMDNARSQSLQHRKGFPKETLKKKEEWKLLWF